MNFHYWSGSEILSVQGRNREEAAREANRRDRAFSTRGHSITSRDLRPFVPIAELCAATGDGSPCLYRRKFGPLCGRHERQRGAVAERKARDNYRAAQTKRRRELLERLHKVTGVSMLGQATSSVPLTSDLEALVRWCERVSQASGAALEALDLGAMGMGGSGSFLGAAAVLRHAQVPWVRVPAAVDAEGGGAE
jgi:hypothetical protein